MEEVVRPTSLWSRTRTCSVRRFLSLCKETRSPDWPRKYMIGDEIRCLVGNISGSFLGTSTQKPRSLATVEEYSRKNGNVAVSAFNWFPETGSSQRAGIKRGQTWFRWNELSGQSGQWSGHCARGWSTSGKELDSQGWCFSSARSCWTRIEPSLYGNLFD